MSQPHAPKPEKLDVAAKLLLGRLSPELLKVQLVSSLSQVVEEYSAPAEELMRDQELQGMSNLDDLAEHLHALSPVDLANELVRSNQQVNLKDIPKQPPLEPFKALLAMFQNLQQ